MPHGHCVLWAPEILVPMVASEIVIFISYAVIPFALFWLLKKRKDLSPSLISVTWLFIAFIFLCGVTHLISGWNYWHANYILELVLKMATAGVSLATMVVVLKSAPEVLKIPSPKAHDKALEDLKVLNADLDQKVRERTAELERQRDEYQAILNGVTDGICELRPIRNEQGEVFDFKIKMLNETIEQIFDIPEEKKENYTLLSMGDLEERGEFLKAWRNVLETGERFVVDGFYTQEFKKYLRSVAVRDEPNDRVLIFTSDVTEREEQKNLSMAQAKMAALGVLAGGIGHEINTPLQVIDGNVRKIRRQLPDRLNEDDEKPFNIIKTTTIQISNIIQNLKKLTRQDAGSVRSISPAEVLEGLQEMLNQKASNGNIKLAVNADRDLKINASEVTLFQILVNLVNNAMDAVQGMENAEITMSVFRSGTSTVVEVQDNGPGVPENLKLKIFEPMFTTKEVGKGTGLGLSLSLSAAKTMGAELKLVQDEFTRFQLIFKD